MQMPLSQKLLGLHNHGFTILDCDGQQKNVFVLKTRWDHFEGMMH
jgi:hypothetical protein